MKFDPEEYERAHGRGGNIPPQNSNGNSGNNVNNTNSNVNNDFKFYVFATAKRNEVILKYNLLTKGCKLSNFGVIFNIFPWMHFKKINVTDQKFDYKARKYLIKEQLEAIADLSLKIRISNPIKYEFEFNDQNGVDINAEIKDTFEATMRRFFANHTNDELVGRDFDINKPENVEIKDGLKELEDRYGIEVVSVRCDKYVPPETILRENAQNAELQANILQAEQQAKINKIEADSRAEVLGIEYGAYNDAFNNYSENSKTDLVKTAMYTNSKNQNINIIAGADNNALNQAAIINGSMQANNIQNLQNNMQNNQQNNQSQQRGRRR